MPHLLIQNGNGNPHKHELQGDRITVGRNPENNVVLDHNSVSGHHAEIQRLDTGFVVRDLGSANGTTLNGTPVQERPIKDGDTISFGPIEARFIQGSPEPAQDREPETIPLPENGSGPEVKHEVKDLKSISSSLRHSAAKVIFHIGIAARLAALKAKIEKLKRIDLNAAHYALGKKCYELGLHRDQFVEQFAAIAALENDIEEKGKAVPAEENETAGGKMKRMGAKAVAETEAAALKLKLRNRFIELGEAVAEKGLPDQSSQAERDAVTRVTDAIRSTEQESAALQTSHPGYRRSAARLAVVGIIFAALLLAALWVRGRQSRNQAITSLMDNSGEVILPPNADQAQVKKYAELRRKVGERLAFTVVRKLPPEKFDGIDSDGGTLYEVVFQRGDHGIIITHHTEFTSQGQAILWLQKKGDYPGSMDSGFSQTVPVYDESPREAVEAFEKWAQAQASKMAAQSAAQDRQNREEALNYAAAVFPKATSLPEIHLSRTLQKMGFTAKVETPRLEKIRSLVSQKNWDGVWSVLMGSTNKLSSKADVELARDRLKQEKLTVSVQARGYKLPERNYSYITIVPNDDLTKTPERHFYAMALPKDLNDLVHVNSSGEAYLHLPEGFSDELTPPNIEPHPENNGIIHTTEAGIGEIGHLYYFAFSSNYWQTAKDSSDKTIKKVTDECNAELQRINQMKKLGRLSDQSFKDATAAIAVRLNEFCKSLMESN